MVVLSVWEQPRIKVVPFCSQHESHLCPPFIHEIILLTYIPMNKITCNPVMDTHKDAIRIAAAKLGFANLKSHQLEVILAFITGNDVFAVLPTGYG